MATKHTPGPWELDGVEIYPVKGHPAYGAICELSPGQGDERFTANARLIAAAPALLEALSEILDGYLYGCDMKTKRENIKKAHAAIALATLNTNEQSGL